MTDELELAIARQRQARARIMQPQGFVAQAQPAPIPQPTGQEFLREQPGVATNIARSVSEGATFGFSDEIKAAIEAGIREGRTFDEAVELQRNRMERIPAGQRITGNIAGGLLSAPALGLRAPAGLAQAARQGAGLGALAGAGFAEGGPVERGIGAAVGGTLGAPLAAGGQGLAQVVGRAIARVRQGVTGPTAAAMDDVLRELSAGEITPQQAAARVQRLGPEGVLADVPELQRLAQATSTKTGAGQNIAKSALEARRAGAGGRITRALDAAIGGKNTKEARQSILRARRAEAANLYDEALSQGPLQRTDQLASLIGDDAGKGGSTLVRGQLESIRRSNPRFKGMADTDPELLHATRVALSERTKGPMTAGKSNINDIVQQLTDAMDDAGATGYRNAVDQYRSDSLMLEAFDKGRKALNELPENIEEFMKTAPTGEQEAFVSGLGREMLRQLETGETKAATTGIRNIFRGERAQILREALGPEGYSAFRNRLLREIRFSETGVRTLGQSITQPRQAATAERLRGLGRLERAGQAVRGQGSLIGAAAELATPRGAANIPRERALAQLLFRSQGQGLPSSRFAAETPLLELAQRQRLLQGAGSLTAPLRGALGPGAAGVSAGRASDPLLGLVGF